MKNTVIQILIMLLLVSTVSAIPIKNPIISRGKQAYTSKGIITSLTNNKFGGNSFAVSDGAWLAIKLDTGVTKVFFTWNNPAYPWSNELAPDKCPNSVGMPVDYNLLISSNSTNGTDGDWQIIDSIRANIVTARGHLLNVQGSYWLKMAILKGSGYFDEVEIFDASQGHEDTWFFPGTSISANTYKGTPPSVNFADQIKSKHAEYTPAMIRGGIGCISSSDLVKNLSKYLKMAGNTHYWAIEMGTNDAWGGTNGNVATFKANLQKVIDSCKAYGIEPIIAKVLATNETAAGWQVNSDFQTAIDELTTENNLYPGPDLFAWFLNNPTDLNADGVHPNAKGAASIQRLWAEKMDSLYCNGKCPQTAINQKVKEKSKAKISVVNTEGKTTVKFDEEQSSLVQVYNSIGNLVLVKKVFGNDNFTLDSKLPNGVYFLKVFNKAGINTSKFVIN